MRAARMALNERIPMTEACERVGTDRGSVHHAFLILRHGTEAEIASIDNNEAAVSQVAKEIRKRLPPEDRRRGRLMVHSAERRHQAAIDSAIWTKLRDAIGNINSLPRPQDVVSIVKANQQRKRALAGSSLINALTWIMEFSDAYTKQHDAGDRDDHAGDGHAASGMQRPQPPAE